MIKSLLLSLVRIIPSACTTFAMCYGSCMEEHTWEVKPPQTTSCNRTRGLNAGGLNARGLNARGLNARGLNARGLNARGLNARGLNARGLNARGLNARGLNAGGLNARGLNARGLNARGLNAGHATAQRRRTRSIARMLELFPPPGTLWSEPLRWMEMKSRRVPCTPNEV